MFPPDQLLLLVPTRMELSGLQEHEAIRQLVARGLSTEECGMGLLASAFLAPRLIERHRPAAVLLGGIAGRLGGDQPLGTAAEFGRVFCDGIGAGSGGRFVSVEQMGWRPFAPLGESAPEPALRLGWLPPEDNLPDLLSVCAAAGNEEDRCRRTTRFPAAAAEDMESWSVAVAAQLAGVPLRVFRGLSNVAGQRDQRHWQVGPALAAVAGKLAEAVARQPAS